MTSSENSDTPRKIRLPNSINSQLLRLKTCKNGSNSEPTLLGHFLIAGSLVILISGGFFCLNWYADKKAKEWLGSQEELSALPSQRLVGTAAEKTRLDEQFKEIQLRIQRHSAVMSYFYKQYYISISMTYALGLLAGICLFFISKVGWKDANKGLINVFIITSSAALFYRQLPGIFRQDTNMAANRNLYLDYISLKNEVLSYAATGGIAGRDGNNTNSFTTINPKIFIYYVDQKLAKLNQIPIDFDITRVTETPDFKKVNSVPGISGTPESLPKKE
ncbi:MAG TPA: hypothetical protein DCZ55_21060 [Cyanobacteria bacterium UBA11371]|nr:hypothetical protein [Cyanobacteria bacterium UBA11371]